MGFTIREQAIINDNFKELIRGGNYEKLIEQLMNDSQKIFPNKYKHLEKQSKGESDFIDLSTNQKYDAKLLFSEKDGKLVGSRNSEFGEWMQIKLDEVAEFSEYIEKRGQFDIATARAVAAMPVLSEYCMPYVKKGGMFVALKSVNEEITESENAIKVLGGKLIRQTDYSIANGDNRRLFVIEKISDTPTKYPRNPSMIKKKPL